MSLKSFLRKTALWILLVPASLTVLGAASNQAVLFANNDKFPVMWNDFKVNQYAVELAKIAADDDDPRQTEAELRIAGLEREGFIDDTHVIMTPKTHLNLLGDIFDFKSETDSIGDLILDLGDVIWPFAPFIWAFTVIGKLNRQE